MDHPPSEKKKVLKKIVIKNGKKKRKPRRAQSSKLPVMELMGKAMSSLSLAASTITLPESRLQQHEPVNTARQADLDDPLDSARVMRRSLKLFNSDMSVGSSNWDSSIASDLTSHTVTTKCLISALEKATANHLPPPDYLTPLSELSPVHLSWNRLVTRQADDDSRDPRVNIIGCMHPVQLILAKADKRIRKQQKAQELKTIQCEQKIIELNEVIEWKSTRAERYAKLLAVQQVQVQWMKLVVFLRYCRLLAADFVKYKASNATWIKVLRSAGIISKYYFKWYRKHLLGKLQSRVTSAFTQVRHAFRLYVRIYRKKKATAKIKTFFLEYKNHHKMNVVVHRYLSAVRRVQRGIREFLRCKTAKVEALTTIWDRIEYRFIQKKLEQKKERMKNTGQLLSKKGSRMNLKHVPAVVKLKAKSVTRSSISSIGGDDDDDDNDDLSISSDIFESKEHGKMLIEMKHQAKNWQRIDVKMENMIVQLRHAGVIQEEKEEETIGKLMAPKEMKLRFLKQVVEKVRREFYVSQRSIIREKIKMDATFSEKHALDLLRGNTDNIDRIVNNRYGVRVVKLKFQPLNFYKRLDRRLIYDKVKEAHNILKTFHIIIDHHR